MSHPLDRFSGKSTALAGIGLLIALLALPLSQQVWGAKTSPRVVAVGDVHGDLDALVSILQKAGIIDDQRRWSGGTATLVQTGDILDRGAQDRQVMDLLMELEREAPKGGGRVVVLLGNHEMMNIMGDLSYVAPAVYNSFVDDSRMLWMVDHGRSFRRWKELPHPQLISYVDRKVWEKLQALDEAVVRERLKDYLKPYEMEGLLERRRLLVAHIQNLIVEHGEGGVLYSMR